MIVAISQPRYLPAIIYLQRIAMVDKFILLDDVQHSREFETRNFIKTHHGKKWLSISCKNKKSRQIINQLVVHDTDWIDKHKQTIRLNYKNAPFYSETLLDKIYTLPHTSNFTLLMLHYLQNILNLFDIHTELILSSSMNIHSSGADKIYNLLQQIGATSYVSGVNGKEYLGNSLKNFTTYYHHYQPQEYPQQYENFEPWLGFIDYLFNMGINNTKKHILYDTIVERPNFNLNILTSEKSWFIPYAQKIQAQFMNSKLIFNHKEISKENDLVLVLGYQTIIDKNTLLTNDNIYLVHESNLPQGKGWAPVFWQILEDKKEIPFMLLKANDEVDSGDIMLESNLHLTGNELNHELREKQAQETFRLCLEFYLKFPHIKGKKQRGESSFYAKRTVKDSQLNINKTIKEQFNLLRIVNNEEYPAFFIHKGYKYTLKIYKDDNENSKF